MKRDGLERDELERDGLEWNEKGWIGWDEMTCGLD